MRCVLIKILFQLVFNIWGFKLYLDTELDLKNLITSFLFSQTAFQLSLYFPWDAIF